MRRFPRCFPRCFPRAHWRSPPPGIGWSRRRLSGAGGAMNFSEYVKQDAVGLADRVWRREVTADELVALALAQIKKAQPKTNAICRMMETEARAQLVKPLTGAFAGVPFLIKDIAQDYAGLPTSAGSRALQKNVAAE